MLAAAMLIIKLNMLKEAAVQRSITSFYIAFRNRLYVCIHFCHKDTVTLQWFKWRSRNVFISWFHWFINLYFWFSRVSPSEPVDQGCQGDEEQHTDPDDNPCNAERKTSLKQAEQYMQQSEKDTQVCGRHASAVCICVLKSLLHTSHKPHGSIHVSHIYNEWQMHNCFPYVQMTAHTLWRNQLLCGLAAYFP